MSRLPRCPCRHTHRAATCARSGRVRQGVLAVGAAGAACLALAACGGAAGQSTPASNGQSFVSGATGTTVFGGPDQPPAPRVTGRTLSGAPLSLSQFRGHVLVLNFWGSWCTPCRAEAPALAALARHLGPAGVRFLGVDIRDTPATAEAFQRDFHIAYPSLNDPGDVIALAFRDTVPPAGIPTTLIISATGRIAARVIGTASYAGLRGLISKALARPA